MAAGVGRLIEMGDSGWWCWCLLSSAIGFEGELATAAGGAPPVVFESTVAISFTSGGEGTQGGVRVTWGRKVRRRSCLPTAEEQQRRQEVSREFTETTTARTHTLAASSTHLVPNVPLARGAVGVWWHTPKRRKESLDWTRIGRSDARETIEWNRGRTTEARVKRVVRG